jgi:hypothetical protein
MKSKISILCIFLISLSSNAFNCSELIDQTYMTPGDSDFQYQYKFQKNGKVNLKIYMTSHDTDEFIKSGVAKMEVKKLNGTWLKYPKSNKIQIKVKNKKVLHTIDFLCKDELMYMGRKRSGRALQVVKTIPQNHSFSIPSLWISNSKMIRVDFSKKKK